MDTRKAEAISSRHWWSGLFSRRNKQPDHFLQPLVPVSLVDSTLTEEDLIALLPHSPAMSGFADLRPSRPTQVLLNDLIKRFYELTPFLGTLTTNLKGELITCRDHFLTLRKQMELLEDRLDYEVDIDLLDEKAALLVRYHADQVLYESAMMAYSQKVDKLRARIYDIDQQITRVNAEQIINNLRELELYQKINHEINERIERAELAMESASCFSRLFCWTPKAVQRAYSQIEELERRRGVLGANNIDALRSNMVVRLKEERQKVRESLEAVTQAVPLLSQENRAKLVRLEARVHADEAEYYHAVPESAMLQMVRLYESVRRVLKSIPDVEHLTVLENTGVVFSEDEIRRFKGIYAVFSGIKSALKEQLSAYYCLIPGRFEFPYFLEQYRQLGEEDRERFLRGEDGVLTSRLKTVRESPEAGVASGEPVVTLLAP